jgi:galactokinase
MAATANGSRALERSVAGFRARFGRPPRYAAAAPGRVNLIGEHTDYNEGFVLPMAIERRTYVSAAAAPGPESTLAALDLGEEARVNWTDSIDPRPGSFAGYILGVASEFRRLGHRVPSLDMAIAGDVPIGSGLASSAALEVATATLLEDVLGLRLDPLEKALLCQRAEHEFAGTPCGIMDMLVAIMAKPGCALLIDCRSNTVEPVPIWPAEDAALLVFETGVRHELASSAYGARQETCRRAAAALGLAALREAETGMILRASMPATDRMRALHVVTENARTIRAAESLRRGDLEALGALMFASHESLRDLFEVTCPELDLVVAAAARHRGHGGVLGARMTGGGFGGCAIVLARPAAAGRIARSIRAAFRERFGRSPRCFTTRASGPAASLSV